jgi:hypothetical protein
MDSDQNPGIPVPKVWCDFKQLDMGIPGQKKAAGSISV